MDHISPPVDIAVLKVYQKMIDRGWRRSGEYCYKPDLKRSCCPQYTIRLDALEFKPSKSQRKLLNRWNKHIIYGEDDNGTDAVGTSVGNSSTKTPNKPPNKSPPASFVSLVHASETSFITDGIDPAHKFEVTIEPSSFTEEKFALFQSYEKHIHKKDETKPSGFRRFLVDTPLVREEIPYSSPPPSHLPTHYGAHHQLYRLDGELIAMGVIDILPNCVSSVYFMWEKRFEKFSLGKISALREASLAREIREAGAKHMGYLYMGFYIQSCQKMRYKGEYAPSYLADPEEYTWHPIETCKPLLEKTRYVSFAHPEHSTNEPADPSADIFSPPIPPLEDLSNVLASLSLQGAQISVTPVTKSSLWRQVSMRQALLSVIHVFGLALSKEVIFWAE